MYHGPRSVPYRSRPKSFYISNSQKFCTTYKRINFANHLFNSSIYFMEGLRYSPEEDEGNELGEIPDHYDAAVVQGGGWRERFDSEAEEGKTPHLSLEAKMRVMACGILASNDKIKQAIFSGGHTLGEKLPSEAEVMKKYFQTTFPELKDFPILLEDDSYDTSENAIFTKDILNSHDINTAFTITSDFHIKRAQKLFSEFGIKTYPLSAEGLVKQRSLHHKEFIEKYLGSKRHLKKELLEYLFRSAMIVDRKQRILRKIAHKTRNN